jgi:hypothetical protein
MKFPAVLIITNCIIYTAFAQQPIHGNNEQLFNVGYENIITTDSGRLYKPNTSIRSKFHYRPVEIDLWYPASGTRSKLPVLYGEFLDLLQQRSNRFQDDTVYKNISQELVLYICTNLKISDSSKLTQLRTNSYRQAEPIEQRFPLIIYMCAYNGMSFENVRLFEWMAAHGYVVACITSVGLYPGNMSTHPVDLMEQVYDGSFAINYLKKEINIDSTKIGVIGYSWGGLAALELAMNYSWIKSVLSLDGSEMHYYGDSKEEDLDFDELRTAPFFKPEKINIPYAYLESGYKLGDRNVDSIFNIITSLRRQKIYVHFPKATHEDFSYLPSLPFTIAVAKNKITDLYNQFNQFALNYFNVYLKDEKYDLRNQLSGIYQQHMGDSLFPAVPNRKNVFIVGGRIIDSKTNETLAFVNVGVPGKNTGTVTTHDGSFLIKVDSAMFTDSIKISMSGYYSRTISLSDLLKQQKPVQILLNEKFSALNEVVISSRLMREKTKGNTTTSNFVSIGLPLKFLGSETGVKINLGKDPVLLKKLTFNISENRLDTAVFRLNIYSYKNGAPSENILQRNILLGVGSQKGKYSISLTDYKLVMKGDVLVSLEWIEGSSAGRGNGAIFLSAGFLNSATWHRLTSQADWKKATGLGVGINLTVQELKN